MCPVSEDASDAAACPDGELGGSPADAAGMGESSGGVDSSAAAPVACFLLLRGALGEDGAGTVVVEFRSAPLPLLVRRRPPGSIARYQLGDRQAME